MRRPLELSPNVRWWPSTLWQTTTLEVRRDGVGLLVDPGIAPWEVHEAAAGGVEHVLITHADWDHVMGIALLPDAVVHAGAPSAARIRSGEAAASVRREAAGYYLPSDAAEGMRVDDVVEAPGEGSLGPWAAFLLAVPGHTDDSIATWLPDERLAIVGDYLSPLEIPFVYYSVNRYRSTLELLSELVSRERPTHVVVGHGAPLDPDRALRIAGEDLAYLDALIAYAASGGDGERPEAVSAPVREGGVSEREHAANVRRACEEAA